MAGRLLDYVGQGLAADLPVAADMVPLIAPGGLALYYANDTGVVYSWDSAAVAWNSIGFADAPSDGSLYARLNAAWSSFTVPTTESIQDMIAAFLVADAGVTLSYNDAGNALTITCTITQYTDEMAQDAIAAALTAGTGITIAYNDVANTITITSSVTQYTDEMAQDAVGTIMSGGTGITVTYNDGANTITVAVSDAELLALAGLVSAADKIPYFTGSGTAALLTRDTDVTLAANSDTVLATQKAIKAYVDGLRLPQIQSVTSSATVTPTFANDGVKITAQAAALTLANPTGTAAEMWGISIRIKDDGTARAISYGTQYRAMGVTLPTTTAVGKTTYLGMIYNSTDTKWDVVAVAQEA